MLERRFWERETYPPRPPTAPTVVLTILPTSSPRVARIGLRSRESRTLEIMLTRFSSL